MKQDGFYAVSQESYKLPVVDTDTARRNFPSWEKKQYFVMEDIVSGDTSGTTDSDYETHTAPMSKGLGGHRGYTKINFTQGKGRKRG